MCVPGTAPSPSPTADLTLSWESSSKDFYCTSTHSVSHSGPERLTVMVQPSNSSDSMSGGAQLELNFHWQSSMEMKSRDGDGETSFTLEPRAWLSLTSYKPSNPKVFEYPWMHVWRPRSLSSVLLNEPFGLQLYNLQGFHVLLQLLVSTKALLKTESF